MNILIVSATVFEIAPLTALLEAHYEVISPLHYQKEDKNIFILITGVGMTATAFALGRALAKPGFIDLVFNFGIAGAYNDALKIGDVVFVATERFGDLGVEEANGDFTDLFELGLVKNDEVLYNDGKLINPITDFDLLPAVSGTTVNTVNGSAKSIDRIKAKYSMDIETMEGAAVAFACLQTQTPFYPIRAISNYVEPRNRDNWNLPLAIDNLNEIAWALLNSLVGY
jgi:futalosine hydrolase